MDEESTGMSINDNDVCISGEWLKLKYVSKLDDGNTYLVIRTILPGMYLIKEIEDDEDSY